MARSDLKALSASGSQETFQASDELLALIRELEQCLGSFAFYGPTFAYQQAVDRDEIKQGEDFVIDCGNSGTTMRLLAGWLAGQGRFDRCLAEMGREKVGRMVELLEREIPPQPSGQEER